MIIVIAILCLCVAWSWLFQLDILKVTPSVPVGFAVVLVTYAGIIAISFGVGWLAYRTLVKRLIEKPPKFKNLIKLILIWAFFEAALAWLLSVLFMGHNGSWDSVLPFTSFTPWVVHTPLRFLSRLVGFHGLSAICGVGIMLLVTKRWRAVMGYSAVIFALVILSWALYTPASGSAAKFVVVSEILGLPTPVESSDADFILLPEYGLNNQTSESVAQRLPSIQKNVYFSGTKQVATDGGTQNVLIYGSTQQGFLRQDPKSRLIVGGEHLPYSLEVILKAFYPTAYNDFQVRRAVVKGDKVSEPFRISDDLVVGNAACSSIINTEDYRRLTRQGATVLANSASLEIFQGSRLFQVYHDGFAKFIATANARPFLQSSNEWKGFALDYNGRTVATVKPIGSQSIMLHTNNRKTPYSFMGEWLALLGGLYAIKIFVLARAFKSWKKLKQKKQQ